MRVFIYLNKTIYIKGKGFLLQALQKQAHQNSVVEVTVFSNWFWFGVFLVDLLGFFCFGGFDFVLPWFVGCGGFFLLFS